MSNPFKLEIRQEGKSPMSFDIAPGIYTIGSDSDCKIQLPHPHIDARHSILTVKSDSVWIEDLEAQIGTMLDGERIFGRQEIKPGQKIGIGPFVLVILDESLPAEKTASAPEPKPAVSVSEKPETTKETADDIKLHQKKSIKQQIHRELVKRLDIKRMTMSKIETSALNEKALSTIRLIVKDVSSKLPEGMDPDTLVREIYDEAIGLGPLEEYLADPTVTEIMVNGPNQVYVERAGRLERCSRTFTDETSVLAVIERIVSPLGRRIDESSPYVDARLPDGSRVNAIIHPLSLVGPCITIRKFSKVPFTDLDLIRFGTMTQEIAEFARVCVLLRKNIVVSGGTGSGKTSLLNVLSSYLPDTDRIVTIEDAAELRLKQAHVVRLEARPANIEGRGAITIRDLVRNALRMRPDRIVVGECRGGEALDMLQAMNTGHDGSLTTVHANSPRDVMSRLETMVLMSGMDLPIRAIREQIASAIDLVVHESRFSDGTRKITKVTEVVGLEGDRITMQDIFEYVQTGVDEKGGVKGHFGPTGAVPKFIEEVESRGLTMDRSIFDPSAE